jgi:hypothetical protein
MILYPLLLVTFIGVAFGDRLNPFDVFPRIRERQFCSGYYDFGVSVVDVVTQRSSGQDTIYIAATVAVDNQTTYNFTSYYGKHGKGNFSADIAFQNIPVPPTGIATLAYLIINSSGGNRTQVEQDLLGAVVKFGLKAGQIAAGAAEGETYAAAITDTIEDAALGVVEEATIGIALTDFVTWLGIIGVVITDLIIDNCDGFLAAGVHAFSGENICSNAGVMQGTDASQGVADQKLLGFIPGIICNDKPSLYNVDWFAGVADNVTVETIMSEESIWASAASRRLMGTETLILAVVLGYMMMAVFYGI